MTYRTKYGMDFPESVSDLEIELWAFRVGWTAAQGGLGKEEHFIRQAQILYPDFVWHPWAEQGLNALCNYESVGFTGCASSGKTGLVSIWGLSNYICSPHNTLVAVTTTSMNKAKKLIWGDLRERYMRIPGLPFKIVDSPAPMIRLIDPVFSDRSSISLIPAEQNREAESIEKLVGLKNERVFLLIDEGPVMPAGIVSVLSNLTKNPYFQVAVLGNAMSVFDPHGLLCTPRDGWRSISVEDDHWITERGICVHFDGYRSPNLKSDPPDKFPFIYRTTNLEMDIKLMGENSPLFWQQVRGFWREGGNEDCLYSAGEISKAMGMAKGMVVSDKIRLCGADPAFTSGGDRFILYFATLGRTEEGKMAIEFDEFVHLKIDLVRNSLPDSYQYMNAMMKECVDRKVEPAHVGIDATGAGQTFYELICMEWSRSIRRVGFGERASTMKVDPRDELTGADTYALRVDELWGVGVRLLRDGRIFGIHADFAKEMISRRYRQGDKIRLETKKEMKSRTGHSPDIADAGFVCLDVARQLGLGGGVGANTMMVDAWVQMREELENARRNPEMDFHYD